MPDDSRHQVNLLDFFAFLLRWRRFIAASVFLVVLTVTVIVYLVPVRYKSTAVVRPQESGDQGIGSLIASKMGTLGGLANLVPSLGGNSPLEMYMSILKSRWMAERVIEHFGLRSVYKMQKGPIEDVIEALASRTMFDKEELSTDMYIQVEDHDPVRARDMAQFYADQLDKRNQELKSLAASSEKEFVGHRLDDERARLAALEDSLYSFQLETGVLNIEEQIKATIQASAALEAQRLATEVEFEMNRQMLGLENPETEFTRYKLASIDSSIRALLHASNSSRTDFLLSIDEVPAQGRIYLRLLREIEIQQLLVGYLLQQYEQAKIAELRNTPTLLRLDPPALATRKVWPRRGLMIVIGGFGTFVFASVVALFLEMVARASRDPRDPQHQPLLNIRESWSRRRSI